MGRAAVARPRSAVQHRRAPPHPPRVVATGVPGRARLGRRPERERRSALAASQTPITRTGCDSPPRRSAPSRGAPEYPAVPRLRHRHASHLLRLAKPDVAIYRAFERATEHAPTTFCSSTTSGERRGRARGRLERGAREPARGHDRAIRRFSRRTPCCELSSSALPRQGQRGPGRRDPAWWRLHFPSWRWTSARRPSGSNGFSRCSCCARARKFRAPSVNTPPVMKKSSCAPARGR